LRSIDRLSRGAGRLLALGLLAALSTSARADPVRLGEAELRAVVIEESSSPDTDRANDWLASRFWTDTADLGWRIPPLLALRPSRPSSPQAVRSFALGPPEKQ
jgi:hypothetical protein